MFQPLERQAKPAYERPLDLPSSSDTLKNEEEYASEQADARAVLDQKPILNFDSGMGELGMLSFCGWRALYI